MKRIVLILLFLLFWGLQSVNAQDITTGLVGWWRLNEGTGTSAADSSGNSNTGTLVGSPTWSTPGKIGPYGLSLTTNAMSVDIPASASINALQTITIAAWINVTTTTGTGQRIFEKEPGGFEFLFGTGSTLRFVAELWTVLVGDWKSVGTLTANVWTHVAVTYTYSDVGNVPIFYINGVATTHTTTQQSVGTLAGETAPLVLGNRNADRTLSGVLDDARLYNRVLTATDIATLYRYRSGAKQREGSS